MECACGSSERDGSVGPLQLETKMRSYGQSTEQKSDEFLKYVMETEIVEES